VTARKWPQLPHLGAFVLLGVLLSMIGPLIPSWADDLGRRPGSLGLLFSAQAIGYSLGALATGPVVDARRGDRVLAAGVGLGAVGCALLPFLESWDQLLAVVALLGWAAGMIDVSANTLVSRESTDEGRPRNMNTLHMTFGLGAVVTPFAVAATSSWFGRSASIGFVVAAPAAALAAFLVARSSGQPVRPRPVAVSVSVPIAAGVDAPPPETMAHTSPHPWILAAIGLFYVLYVGIELGFAGWITSFGVLRGFDDAGAAALTTTFWASFVLGRVLAIPLSDRVRPFTLIIGGCVTGILAAVIMAIGAEVTAVVWITTAIFGLSMAPLFASMLTHVQARAPFAGASTSWLIAAAGLGSLVLPYLLGRIIDASGASGMPWAVAALTGMTLAWALVLDRLVLSPRASDRSPRAG